MSSCPRQCRDSGASPSPTNFAGFAWLSGTEPWSEPSHEPGGGTAEHFLVAALGARADRGIDVPLAQKASTSGPRCGRLHDQYNISPFRETQTPAFLEAMSDHPEPLVASVAQFELALRRVKQGDPGRYVISWSHGDPLPILNALAKDTPFEDPAPGSPVRS